jgi:hypothetical protein
VAYAGYVTDGFGSDGTDPLLLIEAFTQGSGTGTALVTDGFGFDDIPAALLQEDFSNYLGLTVVPPTGKQYTTVAGLPWPGGSLSVLQGATPPAVNGDVIVSDINTQPDIYTVVMNSDGTFTINVTFNTARQSFNYQLYRVGSQIFDGPATVWINNKPPQQTLPLGPILAIAGVQMVPYAVSSFAFDPEGDVMTYSISPLSASALPVGVTLNPASGIISGTPTSVGNFALTVRVTDAIGDYTDFLNLAPPNLMIVYVPVGPNVVPNFIGQTWAAAQVAIQGGGWISGPTVRVPYAPIQPYDIVVGQDPPAYSTASPNMVITLTVNYPASPLSTTIGRLPLF